MDYYNIAELTKQFGADVKRLGDQADRDVWLIKTQLAIAQQLSVIASHVERLVSIANDAKALVK